MDGRQAGDGQLEAGGDESDESVGEAEREVLLEQYSLVRDEIIAEKELQNKRITQGITAVGAVTGYGLLRESQWVVALTPFILGVIFIDAVSSIRFVASNARHLIEIESRLSEVTPLFEWETQYGGYYGRLPRGPDQSLFTWNRLPGYATAGVGFLFYLVLIWTAITFWSTRPPSLRMIGTTTLVIVFALFTTFLAVVGAIGVQYYVSLRPGSGEA